MRRALAVTLAFVVMSALGAGCRRDPEPPLRLDGSPRIPDDEGVATALTTDSITLDGERTYDVSDELRAFSTYSLELEPMIGRKGQYVQIGLDGDTMVWMAGVARVLDLGGASSVLYTGKYVGTVDGRFAFADGTTFAPGKGIRPPAKERPVTVRISTATHRITRIR